MLLPYLLVPLMQLFQLLCVVLDVAPRAARGAPRRRSRSRKRTYPQPLWVMQRLRLLESIGWRQCEQMMVPLMQLFQLCRVVLDVALRAARSAPRRRSRSRKRSNPQPLWVVRRLRLLEMLGWRICHQMASPRAPTRESAAAPRAARDVTRRGGGASVHSHTPCSSSSSSSGQRRTRQRRAAAGLMELSTPCSPASASSKRGRSSSPTSRYAGSSAGHTPASVSHSSCASYEPEPEECADGLCGSCGRCAREGRREHQRLRRGALAMLLAPS